MANVARDSLIYRAYLEAKNDPKKNVSDVIHEFKISRETLYKVIRRVLNGNPARIKIAMEEARVRIFWEYKYKARFMALPKDRKPGTVAELTAMIKKMKGDKFSNTAIASFLGVYRSTIIHHLEK